MSITRTILAFVVLAVGTVTAQQTNPPPPGGSRNPYLIQGFVSPAPMLPAEFNGTGSLIFDVGNTGSDPIIWVANQSMLLTISLSYGVPNVANPSDPAQAITAISGPGAAWFSWEYFPDQNTFRGTQKADIPSDSRETIQIAYKVTRNSFLDSTVQNGYNCNISPPPYTNSQPTDDDVVAAYTGVQAFDFGDAPLTYTPLANDTSSGSRARHEIDLTKQMVEDEFGQEIAVYKRYLYFGSGVDPDNGYQACGLALNDDLNHTSGANTDDEDGITIPALIPGQPASIDYTITIVDEDHLNYDSHFSAWIDWNRDGDFTDEGERIASNVQRLASGTYSLNFTVPATAGVGNTMARFRVGPSVNSPTANAAYGEVEDYIVSVGATAAAGTVAGRIYHDLNGNGSQQAGEPNLPNISVTITAANGTVQTVSTDANGNWAAMVPSGNATVDIDHADPGLFPGATRTQGSDPLVVAVVTNQQADGGTAGYTQGLTGYASWKSKNQTSGTICEDHDTDGVVNGIEYFLVGPNGISTGPTTLPSVVKDGTLMRVTYTKAADYAGVYGTDFRVETSTTLQNPWTPEPLGTHVTISGNQIIYTFPPPYLDKFFVRLWVSGP
jgi:hypothetical protein